MSGASKKLMGTTAAAGGEALAIEDVFSTYLYTGNDTDTDIVNGIDLAGNGGLVWIKSRQANEGHRLIDSEWSLSANQYLDTSSTTAPFGGPVINAFNADGFNLDANWYGNSSDPLYGGNFASWTFRKAPRFFDVVTWTGDGNFNDGNNYSREIAHSLGQKPGFIVVKRTDSSSDWWAKHRYDNIRVLKLNTTDAQFQDTSPSGSLYLPIFGNLDGNSANWATDSNFYLDSGDHTNGLNNPAAPLSNISGATYVAYLFAHDPLGPSGDGSDGLIACGSYTGTGAAGLEVNLGWEPQWFLMKRTDTAGSDWFIFDVMRGFTTDGDRILRANTSDAESDTTAFVPTPTGVKLLGTFSSVNASGGTYIYIAIRRGPMRAPTSGTEVFSISSLMSGTTQPAFDASHVVDMGLQRRPAFSQEWHIASRLTGTANMYTNSTASEVSQVENVWDFMDGWGGWGVDNPDYRAWNFRRAPGFFDAVAYNSNGVAGTQIPHNLGVKPELMIVKCRNNAVRWVVYAEPLGATQYLVLDNDFPATTSTDPWFNTEPTESVFTVDDGTQSNAGFGYTYIAYLFATLPGVSKVGSYTGNGSSQTIDCGFTSGARFVLIKRTDSTGDWLDYDTARGINAGDDPRLFLNNTNAEVSDTNSINVDGSGFSVNNDGNLTNFSGGSYIFLAIA